MTIRKLDTEEFDIWFVGYDVNGNSRYVVHYLTIPTPHDDSETNSVDEFEYARAALNGKRYRAKWFGGGIVFQAYANNPIDHVRAAVLGMNPAEYYNRKLAMRNHPAGKSLK